MDGMPGVVALGGLTPGVVMPAAPVEGAGMVPPLAGGVVTVAPPAPTERDGTAGVLTPARPPAAWSQHRHRPTAGSRWR